MRASALLLLLAVSGSESDVPARLVGGALTGGRAYATAQSLTDRIGARPAGSVSAERAVEWALAELRAAGLKNVRKEPVKVPHWVRGEESAELLAPSSEILHVTALGGSVATAAGGVSAEVVEAGSFEEIKALGVKARGRIVLINKPVARSPHGDGYGQVVPLRHSGAVAAAQVGAVAALLRSVGTGAHRLPHTGMTSYEDGTPKIPFAALAAEDADLLHRLLASGEKPRVKLRLGCQQLGDVDSSNVMGEVPGRDKAGEIVLLGAHLDSWDLGTGAIDDGAGCAIVIEAARLIAHLRTPPRRTVRVVLFMNEEFGLSGARAYAERHKNELDKHVAALEADSGAGRPLGFSVTGDEHALALVRKWVAPLATLQAAEVSSTRFGGADVIPMQIRGVPAVGLQQDMSSYFDWHHTAADTLDKIDPLELAWSAGAAAVLAWAAAEARETLPRPAPTAQPSWMGPSEPQKAK